MGPLDDAFNCCFVGNAEVVASVVVDETDAVELKTDSVMVVVDDEPVNVEMEFEVVAVDGMLGASEIIEVVSGNLDTVEVGVNVEETMTIDVVLISGSTDSK